MSQQAKNNSLTTPVRSGDTAGFQQKSMAESNGALRKLSAEAGAEMVVSNTATGALADGFKQFTAGFVGGKPDQASFIVKSETGASQIDFTLAPCPYTEAAKVKADSIFDFKKTEAEQKQG